MKQETWHIIISGKVQGVFYRQSAKEKAMMLGLKGWVRNLEDGRVEIKVSGDPSQLESFLSWCRIGPEKAVVEQIETDKSLTEIFENFRVIR
jgi:acylphosphatase